MKLAKQQTATTCLNDYLQSQRNIDLDRSIRKHVEKTEIIVKKEQIRQDSTVKR